MATPAQGLSCQASCARTTLSAQGTPFGCGPGAGSSGCCAQEYLLVDCRLPVAVTSPCLSRRGSASVGPEETGAWIAAWPDWAVSLQLKSPLAARTCCCLFWQYATRQKCCPAETVNVSQQLCHGVLHHCSCLLALDRLKLASHAKLVGQLLWLDAVPSTLHQPCSPTSQKCTSRRAAPSPALPCRAMGCTIEDVATQQLAQLPMDKQRLIASGFRNFADHFK